MVKKLCLEDQYDLPCQTEDEEKAAVISTSWPKITSTTSLNWLFRIIFQIVLLPPWQQQNLLVDVLSPYLNLLDKMYVFSSDKCFSSLVNILECPEVHRDNSGVNESLVPS